MQNLVYFLGGGVAMGYTTWPNHFHPSLATENPFVDHFPGRAMSVQDRSPKQWLRGRLAHLTQEDDRKSGLKAINEESDKIQRMDWAATVMAGWCRLRSRWFSRLVDVKIGIRFSFFGWVTCLGRDFLSKDQTLFQEWCWWSIDDWLPAMHRPASQARVGSFRWSSGPTKIQVYTVASLCQDRQAWFNLVWNFLKLPRFPRLSSDFLNRSSFPVVTVMACWCSFFMMLQGLDTWHKNGRVLSPCRERWNSVTFRWKKLLHLCQLNNISRRSNQLKVYRKDSKGFWFSSWTPHWFSLLVTSFSGEIPIFWSLMAPHMADKKEIEAERSRRVSRRKTPRPWGSVGL